MPPTPMTVKSILIDFYFFKRILTVRDRSHQLRLATLCGMAVFSSRELSRQPRSGQNTFSRNRTLLVRFCPKGYFKLSRQIWPREEQRPSQMGAPRRVSIIDFIFAPGYSHMSRVMEETVSKLWSGG